jgi:hypothetical protein
MMPTRNAFAAVRLTYVRKLPNLPYHITLQVWSHSYDHPDPNHRSSMVTGVYITQLPQVPPGTNYQMSNLKITDRYGIDENTMWTVSSGPTEFGFDGYTEIDTGRPCQPGFPNVLWGVYTGIYDERCLADPSCDARRLQTYRPMWASLAGFNYLIGPVTFSFDIALPVVPAAVKLRVGHVGGNGGNPAQRMATLPSEEFVIQLP